jgi:hypothetical protein
MKTAPALLIFAATTLTSAAATITNPGFEANSYTTWPGYISGATNGPITGWTATDINRAGLNMFPNSWAPANNSPFANNGAIPEGTRAAFVQVATGAANNNINTTVTGLVPGQTYRLLWRFNSRNNGAAANQRPNGTVSVGGTAISFQASPVEAANSRTLPYRTGALVFTASAATETLTVAANLIAGQTDATLVVDDFQIAAVAPSKWTVTAWTGDGDSGVIPGLTYTHAYNLGTASSAVVNGVPLTGVAGGSPAVPGSFSTTGWTAALADASNNLNSGGSATVADDFVYGSASPTTQAITLDGLTPGTAYRLSLFGVGWADAAVPNRSVTLDNGAGDLRTVNEQQFGTDNGIRLDYEYVATGTSQTFTLNPTSTAASFHLYGFVNVPEPGVSAFAAAGAALLLRRRRR